MLALSRPTLGQLPSLEDFYLLKGLSKSVKKDRLDAGEIVFIAGDRVSCGNSRISQKITFLGNDIDIPVGTFKLAQMMEAQIYFISALKEKNDKYKVYLQKFMLDGEVLTKKEFLLKMQEEYILFLQEVTLKDCLQFYNFYKLWHNKKFIFL